MTKLFLKQTKNKKYSLQVSFQLEFLK